MSKLVPAVAGAVVLGVTIACGSSPNAPSAAPSAVKALKVTGPPLVVSDVAQFTAVATMNDGATSDVTGQATWTSSNTAVATVTATGKVTAVKQGGVTIHAAYRGATDAEYHNVAPLLFFKADGVVAEAPPGFSALSDARVEITAGANVGAAVISDSAGVFSFGSMRGDNYTFKVTRPGFQDLIKTVSLVRDTNIQMLMFPVPPAGATARCNDKSWSFATTREAACTRSGGISYVVCPGLLCPQP
jgi:hypothetical protein